MFSFTSREIKARYRGTIFGFLWMLLNPLLQMIFIGAIFHFFVLVKTDNYFLFLFAGLLPWNFFALSVMKTTPSYVFERALIRKAAFPREAIPLAIIFSNFFHFFIALLLYMVVLVMFGLFSVRWLLLFPIILWILLLAIGFSLLFSTLNVKYRDTNFFVQALLPLWLYATPIIYSPDLLPKAFHFIFYLNPLYYPLTLFRDTLLMGSFLEWRLIFIGLGYLFLVIFLGITLFKNQSPHFDDWM